jgi:hypothetical protein
VLGCIAPLYNSPSPVSLSLPAYFSFICATALNGPGPHYCSFTITVTYTTLGKTPLDERSARRRDLYLTTHNTHNGQTPMPPAGFELTMPASERPQTHALARPRRSVTCLLHPHILVIVLLHHSKLHNLCL